MQPVTKPQPVSAPAAPKAPHGTGVFSNADDDASDTDDFMPSKLLAEINKGASAPSTSAAQQTMPAAHSATHAACPQG